MHMSLGLLRFQVNVSSTVYKTYVAKEIIVRYIFFDPNVTVHSNDKKYVYSLQILTLTLLWHGFNDAAQEGRGW